jgi:ribosomal protein L28
LLGCGIAKVVFGVKRWWRPNVRTKRSRVTESQTGRIVTINVMVIVSPVSRQ